MDFSVPDRAPPAPPALEWEEVGCPLCESRNWAPLVEATDPLGGAEGLWFMVVRCQDCGLCFTNPRPSARSIGHFYPADYVCHRAPVGPKKRRLSRPWKRDPEGKYVPVEGQGRLLDFGCGSGDFLRRMHALGWKVTGVDVSADVVERIKAELGLEAHAGTLPHPALPAASFDAVTMWQALEHVHQPLETLRAAHRLLVPGGKVVVAVPNIDSLPFQWFGTHWYGLDVPRHLTHFTPPTLRQMLERAGFRVHRLHMIRHPGWIRHSVPLLRRTPTASKAMCGLLTSRVGSGLASWLSFAARKSDCIVAVATKKVQLNRLAA